MNFRVQRSLLVGATGPGQRMAEERRILAAHFPGFKLKESGSSGERANVTGSLSTFTDQSYKIRIVLSSNYPHTLPEVQSVGWTPKANPHIIGGGLCVMKASQWQSFMSAAFIVAKTALWLNKYEVYIDRGIWPGPEQHQHDMGYRIKKWWHDL